MRKITFLKMMLLCSILIAGGMNAWGQVTTWTKIANHSDVTETDVYMIVETTKQVALTSANGKKAAPTAVPVKLSSDGLTISAEIGTELQWTFKKSGDNYTIHTKADPTQMLYSTGSNNGVRVGTAIDNEFELGVVDAAIPSYKGLKYVALNRYLGVYSTQDWRTYTTIHNNIKDSNIEFYKLDESAVATTSAPTFSPAGGDYTSVQSVTLASDTEGAKIYYTVDGNEPTSASTPYVQAFEVAETTTVKAIAYDAEGKNPSSVVEASYAIDLTPKIIVTPSTLPDFVTYTGASPMRKPIKISGANLTAGISVRIESDGTDGWQQFHPETNSFSAKGGTSLIRYVPSGTPAEHTAKLIITSTGAADVVILLKAVTKQAPEEGIANETFGKQSALTSDYADGTFNSQSDQVTVNYVHARDAGYGTKDDYSIMGRGIMLRRSDEPSSVEFVFPKGVNTFSFDYRKAFTGSAARVLSLLVDGEEVKKTEEFGAASGADTTVYSLSHVIKKSGEVKVKITYPEGTSKGNKQITLDNIKWTTYAPEIKVDQQLTFVANPGSEAKSKVLKVVGIDLVGDITTKIGGEAASQFTVTPSTLTNTGGDLTVTYTPTADVASHAATLSLSSDGVQDVVIVLTGETKVLPKETFETQTVLTSDYAEGTFESEEKGVTVNFVRAANEFGFPINGKGIQLFGRHASIGNAYVEFVIPGGVGEFSFKYRKAYTPAQSTHRRLGVYVNNEQKYLTESFGTIDLKAEETVYEFKETINQPGTVKMKIQVEGPNGYRQVTIDDVDWTYYVGTGLNAVQIDANAWVLGNKVMLNASAGEVVEIFNVAGQKIASQSATEGLNGIEVSTKGVLIVKVQNRISKVIVK